MMLLLTSAGLPNQKLRDFFVSTLPKAPSACSVLMMAYAQTQGDYDYADGLRTELIQAGIRKIALFNLKDDQCDDRSIYDVIYVCGGNTFAILNRMRITGADEFIKCAVKGRGALYVGVSAGSIIVGPSIAIAGWGSEGDKNEIGLADLAGFGLTDISVLPHFKPHLNSEVEEFRTIAPYPVIALTDEQAIYVNDQGHQLVGQ